MNIYIYIEREGGERGEEGGERDITITSVSTHSVFMQGGVMVINAEDGNCD